MGSDLVTLFHSLGFVLDKEGTPRISPGIIQWVARIDTTSEVLINGCDVGSEIWSTGSGFAPLDMAAFETWSYDLPAGKHLLIAERDISFNLEDLPIRLHRNVVVWTKDDLSRVVGKALLEGRLQVETIDTKFEEEPELTIGPFHPLEGDGPFFLTDSYGLDTLSEQGLDTISSSPILISGTAHLVTAILRGPDEEEEIKRIVLDFGIHTLAEELSLLNYQPRIKTIVPESSSLLDISKLLSQRRSTPSKGGGELLRWWRVVSESISVIEKPVIAPGRRGIDPLGGNWLLNLATGKLLRGQPDN